MVSSNDTIIVKVANSIISKINTLIGNHNSSNTAHSDIRNSIPTTTNQLTNNSGFLTSQDISGKANIADLATIATTGSYNDLDDSPEIPKVFYGTSKTASATKIKEITTSSNYILSEGTILIVYFNNSQSNSEAQLKVNNEDVINVTCNNETDAQYKWRAKEVVPFVYNGTNFIMIDSGEATTTYYGVTKLSNSTSSTSLSEAATPSAVKKAYDLANSKADVSDIPTKVSDLTNDSNFISTDDSRLSDERTPTSHQHGNILNDGKVITVKTIGESTNVSSDYFIIRDVSDSNATKSANVIDVLNKVVLDLIDEGES